MLARGDHKSTQDEPKLVEQLLSKEVVHQFLMIIPIELVPIIPNTMVQPIGLMAKQWTLLDEKSKQKNQVQNHARPLLLGNQRGGVTVDQQPNRNGAIPGKSLWLGPPVHNTLHCVGLPGP